MNANSKRRMKDERIILSINEHWIKVIKPFVVLAFAIIGFPILYYIIAETSLNQGVKEVLLTIYYLALLITVHGFFIYYFMWKVSSSYITNQRIIVFDLIAFLKHDIVFINISEIHEIEEYQHGIIPNILNYGTIQINLAAIKEPKILTYMPEPSVLVNIVNRIRRNKPDTKDELEEIKSLCHKKYHF